MGWSLRIGRILGIDLYLHFTFFILLAWVAVAHYTKGGSGAAASGLVFISLLFAIVVLHELGHALAARRYGIATRDITLLPIGGLARLERMPDEPRQELVVALAGPAVNVALAGVLLLVLWPLKEIPALERVAAIGGPLLAQLLWVNVFLALFNLLPAFPMDGGRVLRALLAMKIDYVRATEIAATVGQGMALLFGVLGLFTNPMLLFIALFVWMGAEQEAVMTRMRAGLTGIPVYRVMVADFRTLRPDEALGRAVELILAGFQQDFPVVDEGRVVGILARTDLVAALAERGQEAPVGEVMRREFETAHPREMVDVVFARLQASGCPTVPVVADGTLVGVASLENIGEFVMIKAALRGRGRTPSKAEGGIRSAE